MENNKKNIYMFNEEVATDYGFFTAKVTIEGKEQEIKYTTVYKNEKLASFYKFKAEKMVGQFDHSELRDIKEHDGKYSEIIHRKKIKIDTSIPTRDKSIEDLIFKNPPDFKSQEESIFPTRDRSQEYLMIKDDPDFKIKEQLMFPTIYKKIKILMESEKEFELPETLKKKKYLFSEESSQRDGYCEVITKKGELIRCTIITEKPEEYKWSDAILVGEFSDIEISSFKFFGKEKIDNTDGLRTKNKKQ